MEDRLVKTLKKLPEVTDEIATHLVKSGLHTIKLVNQASEEELQAVPGIGEARAKKIKQHLKKAKERGKPKE